MDILYGVGISHEGDLLDLGVIQELVEKSGSWYSFGGERIGQGRETARAFLVENPAIADRLDADLRRRLDFDARCLPDLRREPPRVTAECAHICSASIHFQPACAAASVVK